MSSDWEQSSTIQDESSTTQRDVCSFLQARDPSITNPWMRPRPQHGTNLAHMFEEEEEEEGKEASCAHLRVFLRLKPTGGAESLYSVQSNSRLVCPPPPENNPNTRNFRKTTDTYTFTHIFHKNESQAAVFNKMIKDRLRRFIEGNDFTLMTYGASGSGKTYSLMGTDAQPGTIPRCLEFLFAQVSPSQLPRHKPRDDDSLQELDDAQQAKEISVIEAISKKCGGGPEQDALDSYRRMSKALTRASRVWHQHHRQDIYTEVWVSFAEIYNESAFDLLQEGTASTRLRIVQPPNHRPYLKNLSWVCVRSGLEAYAVLKRGRMNLHYARTNVNATSSRSHCIFTMKLVQLSKDGGKGTINTFRLCDLAGLERAKMTENSGERLNESKKINTSLHILERCLQAIRGLQGGQTSLPPYRESKLTTLLQNPLSGKEAVAMLVTINPHRASYDETQHVLKFSALARSIVVEESKERALLMSHGHSRVGTGSLQEEVAALRRDLEQAVAQCRALEQAAELHEEEVATLQQALQDAELECQYREQKVRIETADKFTVILDKTHQDWTERLMQDKSILEQQHTLEIRRWEKCVERLQEDMAVAEDDNSKTLDENQILRKQLSEALARTQLAENHQRPMADCNWSTIDGNVTVDGNGLNMSGDSLNDIVPLELSMVVPGKEGSPTVEDDTTPPEVIPIPPPEVIMPSEMISLTSKEHLTGPPQEVMVPPMQRYRADVGVPVVECYFTDKKQKPEILDKENIGSARRKLFSRHRLDMLAAEPLACLQPRALQLDEGLDVVLHKDSPDPIRPPPVLRPYTCSKK